MKRMADNEENALGETLGKNTEIDQSTEQTEAPPETTKEDEPEIVETPVDVALEDGQSAVIMENELESTVDSSKTVPEGTEENAEITELSEDITVGEETIEESSKVDSDSLNDTQKLSPEKGDRSQTNGQPYQNDPTEEESEDLSEIENQSIRVQESLNIGEFLYEARREERKSLLPIEKKMESPADQSNISLVTSSTQESLFEEKDEKIKTYPLNLAWAFGWNSTSPIYNLHDEDQRVLLYACSHTVVIHDIFKNCQHHLQGHCSVISCLCVSEDRRWIATADKGPESLVIVWDSYSGIPVHTIFDSHPEGSGVAAIAISHDAKYLVTVGAADVQRVCIWKWTSDTNIPVSSAELLPKFGFQSYIIFNPRNNKELVSNSQIQAIFYVWEEDNNKLEYSAPCLTEKTFNKIVGKISQSIFHFNSPQLLSATMEGKLVVWDALSPPISSLKPVKPHNIKAIKLIQLQTDGITVLTRVDGYVVTGDIRGHIKFYDSQLQLVNWYSHFKLSPIKMLSFSKNPPLPPTNKSNYPTDCSLHGQFFVVRNFIIATSDAKVLHLTTDGTKLEKLLLEPNDAIYAITCHPYQPLIAVGSLCGLLKVWNYRERKYLVSRIFEKGIRSLAYNSEGSLIGAGFIDGTVYILDALSLENEIPEPFRYSKSAVTLTGFSHDSQYFATADASFSVAVYKLMVRNGQKVWEYLARLRSHHKTIQTILFGVKLDSNEPRLLSLGNDRLLIEYDLFHSTKDCLEILSMDRTDQGALPKYMVWYPPITKESFFLICNSVNKLKLFNSTTIMCRKTLLGPAYGSPIEQMQILPVLTTDDLQKRYLVFINKDKVGLQILPIDGNPHKTTAIICHPDGVTNLTLSYDGCYAFTAGGSDRSVLQWEINLNALEAAVSLGGDDLIPFYNQLDGGREGEFYRELEDYFYYSQLRSQGIDTMETRQMSTHIPLTELPFIMRAIGFYPSEEMIENMMNEIKFSNYVDTGKLVTEISLPDFIKVYINHRPAFGQTMSGIRNSFQVLGYTNKKGEKAIKRDDFLKLLQTKGEHMTEEELSECFATLFGLNPEGWGSEPETFNMQGPKLFLEQELPEEITAEIFTAEILGLSIPEEDPMVPEGQGW
ncbi:cilia- and flagella-associated protein 251 isoform X1 [Ornithorhynchus anatinus]|uniref:cilia- and flagella-associated protein 251 isoform X1 n=1 Tax=Ornithorhynchus anatinus TaxID=9258 RepID=UPI0010A87083|nr:cilia- and flagella-associated protein 251 isoform X1 [Ornithorhynchus anatinus]